MTSQIRILVRGRVQGVYFRASTQAKAEELNLKGWVRNLPDGRVEVMAQGTSEGLRALKDWCRIGPKHADVHGMETHLETATTDHGSFDILR